MLAALALAPLLAGGWWLAPSAVVVSAVVAAGALARAVRVAPPLQPLASAVALVVSLTAIFAREPAWLGVVPTPAAVTELRRVAGAGVAFVERSAVPADHSVGMVLLIAGGVGLTALVVDTLVAGLDLPGATLAPLAGLFVVPWAIGHGTAPSWTFLVVVLAWVLVLAVAQREWTRRWGSGARAGRVLVAVAATAAVTVAGLLAGGTVAGREPVVTLGPGGFDLGQGGRPVELDAMVSLRRSLVDQDERRILTFATSAARPDYLRMGVLDRFDGEQWTATETSLRRATPPAWAASAAPEQSLAEYRIDVGPLAGSILPSPAGSVESRNRWPVVWDQRTTLPMRPNGRRIQGQRASLVVSVGGWDPAQLRLASTQAGPLSGVFPEDLADPTELVGTQLGQLAAEITTGASTPFDQALALQTWFTTTGGFSYSTDVPAGSDEDALAAFLTDRTGYCEQFAATMALMARTLGIASRVVVGFTQGRQEDGSVWVVRGTDAHAWPELWMGAAGWMRFEPTPGAPSASAPSYAREQTDAPGSAPTSGPSAAAPSADSAEQGRLPEAADTAVSAGDGSTDRRDWLALLAAALAVLVLAMPWAVRSLRRRSRLVAGPEEAYREVVDSAIDLGLLSDEHATVRATLTALARTLGLAGLELRSRPRRWTEEAALHDRVISAAEVGLARICHSVETQRYAEPGPGPGAVPEDGGGVLRPPGTGATVVAVAVDPTVRPRSGSLAGDVVSVRTALAARAGRRHRIVATIAPRTWRRTRR